MTFPHELYPRTSTVLLGVVQFGFIQCGGDNPLLGIQFHVSPIPSPPVAPDRRSFARGKPLRRKMVNRRAQRDHLIIGFGRPQEAAQRKLRPNSIGR